MALALGERKAFLGNRDGIFDRLGRGGGRGEQHKGGSQSSHLCSTKAQRQSRPATLQMAVRRGDAEFTSGEVWFLHGPIVDNQQNAASAVAASEIVLELALTEFQPGAQSAYHMRRLAHALDAAGEYEMCLAELNQLRAADRRLNS